MPTKALCVLDGGQISAACAVIACQQFDEVYAVICKDGQQNQIELESAIAVAEVLSLASYEIVDLSLVPERVESSRLSYIFAQPAPPLGRPQADDHIFPSVRHILLLTLAANQAAIKGIKDSFINLSKEDFAEDFERCQSFLNLMARVLGEGLWRDPAGLKFHTPLMHLNRVESTKLAVDRLGDRFQKVFELTNDCTLGIEGGCGQCSGCLSRDRAFQELGVEDPIWKFRHPEFANPTTHLYKSLF
ncbi:MAG: 7-cyano-7-deazaguanine synthase, partial [Kovacikia sp.]